MANKVINLSDVVKSIEMKSDHLFSDINRICKVIESQEELFEINIKSVKANAKKINSLIGVLADILYTPENKQKRQGANGLIHNINVLNDRLKKSGGLRVDKLFLRNKLSGDIVNAFNITDEILRAYQQISTYIDQFDLTFSNLDRKKLSAYNINVANILINIDKILQNMSAIVDPKQNLLIGNPIKIFFLKRRIKRAFINIVDVLYMMLKESAKLHFMIAKFGKNVSTDDYKKYEMYVNNVVFNTNNIVKSIASLIDPKANPLLGNDIEILIIAIKIKVLFGRIISLIRYIHDQLNYLYDTLISDGFDAEQYGAIYTAIDKLLTNITNIVKSISIMIDPVLNPLIAGRVKFWWNVKRIVRRLFKNINILIEIIAEELKILDTTLKTVDLETLQKNTEQLHEIFSEISNIVQLITTTFVDSLWALIKSGAKFITGLIILTIILAQTSVIIWLMSKLASDEVTEKITKLSELYKSLLRLIRDLNSLFLVIIVTALLAVPAVAAMIIVAIALGALWVFLLLVEQIIKSTENVTEDQHFKRDVIILKSIIYSLGSLFAIIIVTALIAVPAVVAMIIMVLVLGALWVFVWVVDKIMHGISKIMDQKVAIQFAKNIGALLLVIGAIALISLLLLGLAMILVELGNVASSIDIWGVIGFIAGFVALTVVYAGLGAIATAISGPLIVAGAAMGIWVASMLAITAGLLEIGRCLNELQYIELDKEKITKNSKIILETAKYLVDIIGDEAKDESADLGSTILSMVGLDASTRKLKKVLNRYETVLSDFEDLVDVIKTLSELNLDQDKIKQNTKAIFVAAKTVIELIGEDTGEENDNFGDTILSMVGLNKSSRKLKKVLNKYEMVLSDFEDLVDVVKTLSELNLDEEKIKNNTKAVLAGAKIVLDTIGQDAEKEDVSGVVNGVLSLFEIDSSSRKLKKVLAKYENIFKTFGLLINVLGQCSKFNIDPTKIAEGINNVFTTARTVLNTISQPTTDSNTSKFVKASKAYNEAIGLVGTAVGLFNANIKKASTNEIEKALTAYNGFLTTVNKSNLYKLKTTAQLFQEMAKFSESIHGNFEGLANIINEEIMPLLKELKEAFDKVEKGVKENNEKLTANTTVSKDEIRADMVSKGQDRGLTEQEVNRKINAKFNEAMRNNNGINDLINKMATLISLFQSGEARVKTSSI